MDYGNSGVLFIDFVENGTLAAVGCANKLDTHALECNPDLGEIAPAVRRNAILRLVTN